MQMDLFICKTFCATVAMSNANCKSSLTVNKIHLIDNLIKTVEKIGKLKKGKPLNPANGQQAHPGPTPPPPHVPPFSLPPCPPVAMDSRARALPPPSSPSSPLHLPPPHRSRHGHLWSIP